MDLARCALLASLPAPNPLCLSSSSHHLSFAQLPPASLQRAKETEALESRVAAAEEDASRAKLEAAAAREAAEAEAEALAAAVANVDARCEEERAKVTKEHGSREQLESARAECEALERAAKAIDVLGGLA